MKYIKKVIIENFQSHKHTEIEFDQYLNVIVGPSDHGKSAIIRALKWALFNEPSGDFFIREGEKECSVTVIFNDNTKVKRFRSKSKNAYYLYDEDGNETVFEGFGITVPNEVVEKTSMRKISLDGNQTSSINIGEQLEGPFLLSEKSATRANAIGRLVGVHIVDDALKDTLKDIRNLNIKKKNHEETLDSLQKSLKEYDYLTNLIEKANKLEGLKDTIHNKQIRLDKLTQILVDLNKIYKEIKLSEEYLEKLKNLYKVIEIEKELNNKINNFNYINNKYKRLVQVRNQIRGDNELLESLKEIHNTENIIDTINIDYTRLLKLNKLSKNYNYLISSIENNKMVLSKLQEISNVEMNINLIEKDYLKLADLLNLKYKLDSINKSLSIGSVYIDRLANIEKVFGIQNSLETKNSTLKNLVYFKEKYDSIIAKKSGLEKDLLNINNNLDEQLTRYKFILTKIEVCPLCFSKIDSSKIDEIINSYK
jgi:exonuclease SbcC